MKRAILEMLCGLLVLAASPLWMPFVIFGMVAIFLRMLGRCYLYQHFRMRREAQALIEQLGVHTMAAVIAHGNWEDVATPPAEPEVKSE